MPKFNNESGSQLMLVAKDWLAGNANELSWMIVIAGAVILVGVFMR